MARVLIIDDDEDVRGMLSHLLGRAGHEVHAAVDGSAGLGAVDEFKPDLIITDMFMPKVEGLETITELRKNLTTAVPIIAISGGWHGSTLDFLGVAKSMGAARVFRKPVDQAELLSAVTELLTEA